MLALLFAWIFYRSMMKAPAGNDRMQEIAGYVREGAMAYIKRQYSVVFKVFLVLVVLLFILAYLGFRTPLFHWHSLRAGSSRASAVTWE
ncbi:MAG: sodium/proton-translocating pyrophosphatase [Marinilabiliales bacterium]|nr:sodium/proton-translocating pyrophosphatase [Marinilabiliales bacterium]